MTRTLGTLCLYVTALCSIQQIIAASVKPKLHPKHEHLFSKLDDYRLVRPYRSTPDGEFVTHDLSTEEEEHELEYHRIRRAEDRRRRRRNVDAEINSGDNESAAEPAENFHFTMDAFGAHITLDVSRDTRLLVPWFRVERYLDDGTLETTIPKTNCFYRGAVTNTKDSVVAISNCQGLSGWIKTDDEEYIIEPLEAEDQSAYNVTDGHLHVMYRRRDFRSNTTGLATAHEDLFSSNLVNDTSTDDLPLFDEEDVDADDDSSHPRHREKRRGRMAAAGRNNYVETMITVDYAMHSFHGSDSVNIYLITMINIVNTAYAHPSIDANIEFNVVRIVQLNRAQSKYMVVENNAPASLTNVCRWAASQTTRDDTAREHHDHAIFVTKENFGPAGYAPVTGMCAITRSCSLNKDEGLLSSFVLAHESGHVFGMEHDGQGNVCEDDASRGSIMAPVVISTYIHYFWSKCSRGELHRYLSRYYCLWDDPFEGPYPDIRSYPGQRYTMDEQCRFDFGNGYRTCTAFYYNSCEDLWCMHPTSYNCRTRNGPPLDGTACGPGRWCVQGQCRYSQNQIDGRWSTWSDWTECPVTCGTGAQYRTRTCDNPRPQYGGRDCPGDEEQYRLCNTRDCPGGHVDMRAEQCNNFLSNWNYKSKKHTWLPHENRNKTLRCRLTCAAELSGDVVMSEYNVTDGTPVSYDNPENICIRGKSVPIGCDQRIGSNLKWDKCGVCGGAGSSCHRVTLQLNDDAQQQRRYKKILTFSPGLRKVDIKKTVNSNHFLALKSPSAGKYLLNSGRRRSDSQDMIIDGSRFTYDFSNNHERLVTKGPIRQELYLMVYVTRDQRTVNYTAQYFESDQPATTTTTTTMMTTTTPPPTTRRPRPPPTTRRPRPQPVTQVSVSETNNNMDPPPSELSEYVWTEVGWTKCNKKCGGGYSFFRYQCKRRATRDNVRKTYCGMDHYNPKGQRKRCNTHPCGSTPDRVRTTERPTTTTRRATTTIPTSTRKTAKRKTTTEPSTTQPTTAEPTTPEPTTTQPTTPEPTTTQPTTPEPTTTQPTTPEPTTTQPTTTQATTTLPSTTTTPAIYAWATGEWTDCSETCGINGFKNRLVRCINELDDNRIPVNPYLCAGEPPAYTKPCGREPCEASWVTGAWSECSTTCGPGTKTRTVTCEGPSGGAPGSFHCVDDRPPSTKSCEVEPCPRGECVPLDSVICKRNKYRTYCKMPRYVDICCKTCAQQKRLLQQQRARARYSASGQ